MTIYELMTLNAPFESRDWESILTMITSVDPVSPRKLDRAIPRDLETVILYGLLPISFRTPERQSSQPTLTEAVGDYLSNLEHRSR